MVAGADGVDLRAEGEQVLGDRRPGGDEALVRVDAQVGGVIEESALRRRLWAALDRAGLKRVRLHDLRHSYCTMAVRAYRLDEVKAYAGHADIATTMRYVHHIPAHRLSAIVAAAVHPTGEIQANSAQLSATKPLQIEPSR